MYCPECGTDAGDAKFCPECGANLTGVRGALSGKPGAPKTGSAGKKPPQSAAPAAKAGAGKPSGGLSPAIIWGGFAVVAVAVIVIVLFAAGGFKGSSGGSSATGSAQPVAVDTSGDYRTLVTRANDLYDQGDQAFKSQNFEQGSADFGAAAKVYAAALKKQPGDPSVGTDYAVSLFYSGDIAAAIAQGQKVTTAEPTFQPAWFNLGNFFAHKARIADQGGNKAQARKVYAQARLAYTKAVALGPKTATGQQADQALQQLPK